MKRRFYSNPLVIIVFVVLYILALAIGISVASVFTYQSNDNLIDIAKRDAAYYKETKEFIDTAVVFQTISFVYDDNGELIDNLNVISADINFDHYFKRFAPAVVEKGYIYRLIFNRGMPSQIALVIGLPVEINGGAGFYFFVKDMYSLYTVTVVLFSALTPMLLLSMLFHFFMRRRDRVLLRVQRDYVANVSHNLKSPIAAIKALAMNGYEGLIKDEESIKKYSAMILEETDELEHTVLSMLELARIQSGQKDLTKSEITADELLAPIVNKYSNYCSDVDINFTSDIPELPSLYTNKRSILQVFDILLDNAMKFVKAGGNIELSATLTGKSVVICIKDDGIGISDESKDHIFKRFYQSDVSQSTKGSGLGLAIAHEIISAMHEEIWFESEQGNGAAFYFTIQIK